MKDVIERTAQLLQQYQIETDIEKRRDIENEILIINERLCWYVARRYPYYQLEIEDAMQILRMSMLRTIQNFDRQYTFSRTAVMNMTHDLFDHFRHLRSISRLDDYAIQTGIREIKNSSVNDSTHRLLLKEVLTAAPTILPEKEYRVFMYSLGLEGNKKRHDIAKELGILPTSVSNLKKRAFKKINLRFAYVKKELSL